MTLIVEIEIEKNEIKIPPEELLNDIRYKILDYLGNQAVTAKIVTLYRNN